MSEWSEFIPTCEKCGASNPTLEIVFKEIGKQSITKAQICESCEKTMPEARDSLELRGWLGKKE